jgi:hypothetical protein
MWKSLYLLLYGVKIIVVALMNAFFFQLLLNDDFIMKF